MKSTLLKNELKKWERSQLPQMQPAIEQNPVEHRAPKISDPPLYDPDKFRARERVVGGDILWKPVDKVAARLLQKAPWWAQPIASTSPKVEEKTVKRKERKMKTEKTSAPWNAGGTQVQRTKSEDEFNHEIAAEGVKRTGKTISASETMVEKATDARAALDVMANSWKTSWCEFMDEQDERLKTLRMTRMAMDSEMKVVMSGLREVRQFFLDKDYAVEIARLKEFVELCERLKALKESGFLDTVANTMLKL